MNNEGLTPCIILILLSYKKDIDDTRESPSLKIMELFEEKNAHVDYNDPYIPVLPKMRKYSFNNCSVPLHAENLAKYDAVVIATAHSDYDPDFILKHSNLIVDTRNLIKNHNGYSGKVKRA